MAEKYDSIKDVPVEVAPRASPVYDFNGNVIDRNVGRGRMDTAEGARKYFSERFRQFKVD